MTRRSTLYSGKKALSAIRDLKPLVWALIPYGFEGSRLTAETYSSTAVARAASGRSHCRNSVSARPFGSSS